MFRFRMTENHIEEVIVKSTIEELECLGRVLPEHLETEVAHRLEELREELTRLYWERRAFNPIVSLED